MAKVWLQQLGLGLARVEIDDELKQRSVRQLGLRLSATRWQIASGLESVPYIDGTPAGAAREVDVLWKGTTLFVEDRPVSQVFRAITQELSRAFDSSDIGDAIRACVDRSPDFILGYLEENFSLRPVAQVEPHIDDEEKPEVAIRKGARRNESDIGVEPHAANVEKLQTAPGESEVRAEDVQVAIDGNGEQLEVVDEHEVDESSRAEPRSPHSPPLRPAKPRLIELMVASLGFEKDESDRYFHADGSWIAKSNCTSFPWDRFEVGGDLVHSYWLKECCLQREPVQLDAAIWNLCSKFPDRYSIVLRALDDGVCIFSGSDLKRLMLDGQLTLHPANYRLVYFDSEEEF